MIPCGVCLTKNSNASNTRSVPSHMYLLRRGSRLGSNTSAKVLRTAELMPSEASTRSWVAARSSTSGAGVRKWMVTPRSVQRRCSSRSSSLRLIAAKPWPPEVRTWPR
ncbi:Uncharacterised protein [Mycobacteroides abscessus subsp. abscessus]|nr:Uncharacterised protein [Mycobacteroides abscessus subsp. abscessus]